MNNLILFINSFLSYLLVALVIVILGAIAITIGITMRKRSDAKLAALEETAGTTGSGEQEA